MVDINLDRHTVIEASAGTGKTYTLVELVLRLLTEKEVRLDQILLLTYTEKATGELKGRLRERLEKALGEPSTHKPFLLAALDSFDQAHVHTIHSFCQRALQDYAFENGQEFRSQLVDDRDLLETCLREIQRKNWQEDYRERLGEILDLSGYTKSKTGGEGWEDSVRQLAERFRPNCSHMLRPKIATNWPDAVWEYEATLRAKLARWRELAGPFPSARISDHPWSIGFKQLDHQARVRDPRHDKLLLPLLELLADRTVDDHPLIAIQDFMKCCEGASNFKKWHFLLLTKDLSSKAQVQLPRLCLNLCQVVDELEVLREDTELLESRHQLAVRTIHDLQDHLSRYKRERGLQSFEDMLTRLHEALNPDKNPAANLLLERLRDKYKFAIVDEFQDTDPIQWNIFKRIFVQGTNEHRIFVVGDPKQAIFGFRGADLHAYLTAKDEIVTNFQGLSEPLEVNWRSSKDLLDALNPLFQKSDWFKKETGITYNPVRPPPVQDRQNNLLADESNRPALLAVDMTEPKKLSAVKRFYARFISQEIFNLLTSRSGKPALTIKLMKESPRELKAGDICVLVYKRSEANPVVAELQKAGIPFTFYKQPGLWQSDEASHLNYLLRGLARPEDIQAFHKGLLTRFYDIKPEQLSACEELPPDHEVRGCFDRWVELAEERDWARLFQSLLEDTGVLIRDLEKADAERRLANYRHILQTLAQNAYGLDLDLLGILEFLREQRRHGSDEDSDLQPIETEQAKVKIMTIHASKGLEFPVVFLAGGFTRRNQSDYLTYHLKKKLVLDLQKNDEAMQLAGEEQDQEDRRLLYVALTRAMFRLYVPKVNSERKYPSRSWVATILAPAIEAAGITPTAWSPARTPVSSTRVGLPSAPLRAEIQPIPIPKKLFPQPPSDLWRRRILVRSFSSLHRTNPLPVLEGPSYTERPPRADDDKRMVLEKEEALRGTAFGSLIHDVLERINFTEVGEATRPDDLLEEKSPARQVIGERVDWYLPEFTSGRNADELRVSARQQVARLVWNGLHTPLAVAGCALWQIPPQDRLQELEFYYPELDGPPPAEVKRAEGFLTGFMDLVFRKNNQYFLVDWKTNALPGYSPQEVAQSMRESDYRRQYLLYLLALYRWLKRIHAEAFSFTRDFGGVYYLYLRGMNGKDETSGVFFHQPTEDDLQIERVLAATDS